MIYETKGVFVISSHGMWLPGSYDSKRTANYAFRFSDQEISNLQESSGRKTITFEMLQKVRKMRKVSDS